MAGLCGWSHDLWGHLASSLTTKDRMKRHIVLAAVSSLVISLIPGGVAQAAVPAQTITWAPCPEDSTAECGTLKVPIDWDIPGGATVDLAVARRKAAGPATRIGSLV